MESHAHIPFFKRFYLFNFRERGREGEREGEKYHCVVSSHVPPTGDLAHNLGMCHDWELNRWPFGLQACTQSTKPHYPGHTYSLSYLASEHTESLGDLSLNPEVNED